MGGRGGGVGPLPTASCPAHGSGDKGEGEGAQGEGLAREAKGTAGGRRGRKQEGALVMRLAAACGGRIQKGGGKARGFPGGSPSPLEARRTARGSPPPPPPPFFTTGRRYPFGGRKWERPEIPTEALATPPQTLPRESCRSTSPPAAEPPFPPGASLRLGVCRRLGLGELLEEGLELLMRQRLELLQLGHGLVDGLVDLLVVRVIDLRDDHEDDEPCACRR